MTKAELLSKPLEERRDFLTKKVTSQNGNFGMYSNAGGKRVKSLIVRCIKKVMNKKAIRRKDFEQYITEQIKKVSQNEKYSEIGDTAVEEVIWFHLTRASEFAEYEWYRDLEF